MKILQTLLLALCTLLSVHATTQTCGGSVNCTCDLSKYNSSVKPPSPTINCTNGVMTVYISKCQLEKSLFNTSNLALLNNTDPDCTSTDYLVDGEVQVGFHNPMSSTKCGNRLQVNATYAIYTNILHIYPEQHPVMTRNNATANLTCIYPLTYHTALNITLKPVSGNTDISVPGVTGTLTVYMTVYTDAQFSQPVTDSTTLTVEQTVYIEVVMPELDANQFNIKVLRIYATPGATDPGAGQVYNLTSGPDGCPDPTYGVGLISVINNGNGSSARYSMSVFQITNQIFLNLYSDITICNTTCAVNCNQKIGKSYTPESVATVNVALVAESDPTSGATGRFSTSWTLVSLISLLIAKFM
ncbi:pancreatic secretory granule membrane major glycoprotein GP2-like [Anomaloglossus baeobatrachus]|uniref:pancreatic secretory granule membrane major glycoprotein GP2-like n=1 Tax=Anomaloglossus baeobatrachus TaxID=238106 RepID=UPI003F4F7205